MKRGLRLGALIFGLVLGSFFMLFAADSFPSVFSLKAILGFASQLLPGLLIVAGSLISYRKPVAGIWIFTGLALLFTVYFSTYRNIQYFTLLTLPLLAEALLLYSSLPSGKKEFMK